MTEKSWTVEALGAALITVSSPHGVLLVLDGTEGAEVRQVLGHHTATWTLCRMTIGVRATTPWISRRSRQSKSRSRSRKARPQARLMTIARVAVMKAKKMFRAAVWPPLVTCACTDVAAAIAMMAVSITGIVSKVIIVAGATSVLAMKTFTRRTLPNRSLIVIGITINVVISPHVIVITSVVVRILENGVRGMLSLRLD